MDVNKKQIVMAYAAIIAALVMWTISFVTTKFALEEIDPYAMLLLRIVIGTLILLAISAFRHLNIWPLARKHWRQLLPLSLTGIFFTQLGWTVGLSYTQPSHSSLIYTLIPLITAVLSYFYFGEKLTFPKMLGMSIAFVGAALLATEKGIDFSNSYFIGDLWTFGAANAVAYYATRCRKLIQELGAVRFVVLTFAFSAPFALAVGIVPLLGQDWSAVSSGAYAALIYLILFPTVAAMFLYNYALKYISAITITAFSYIQPIGATFLSVIFLGEILSLQFTLSMVLVFLGLFIFLFLRKGRKSVNNA
jgi:drug/metabolite transporter (DMT)-like permease